MRTQARRSAIIALLAVGGIQAGLTESSAKSHHGGFSPSIRPALQEQLEDADPDQFIPITILLREQVGAAELDAARHGLGRDARRQAVVDTLRNHARQTSADVVARLEMHQAAGRVDGRIRELWIRNVIAARATAEAITDIAGHDDVAAVRFDQPVREDIFVQDGGSGNNNGYADATCGIEAMNASQAWSELGLYGEGVVIGVIDSGACLDHPDLAGQLWHNPGEVLDGTDTNGNGYVDDVHGWNFKDDNNDLTDQISHGTHVAGTALGSGESGMHTGVAPGAQLMTLKIWGSTSGESTVWEAMQYGVENGADVLTGSIGWLQDWNPDRATWRAVTENAIAAGVVVLYAAGNEGDCCLPHGSTRTPGDVPDVITVGATDCSDELAEFSSVGPVTWQDVDGYHDWPYPPGKRKPTVVAPGVNTISTHFSCSGYASKSGTSMATPHVAGVAALLLEANPELDHHDVKAILEQTASPLDDAGPNNFTGAGRVDAYEAALVALVTAGPPGDLTGDGGVNGQDLGVLLSQWGECPEHEPCPADLNGDGVVDGADLGILLSHWNEQTK